MRRASNNQRREFHGAEQLQFQFASGATTRGRGVLLRTYQSMRLGKRVELKILPEIQKLPSFDVIGKGWEGHHDGCTNLWA
ncbi:hypothetical protein [Sphingomonas sp. BK481]|uniref:hypothetical protein n=1 Tax=Sphingomonas sp. BK481 TaxID=2586981 RepID=UPI001617C40F|nr:hypothetical protein [Sphingomonas sp. BK481]MBB3588974.1 hypothetical protein [Sphingomonas sp. BK481]